MYSTSSAFNGVILYKVDTDNAYTAGGPEK